MPDAVKTDSMREGTAEGKGISARRDNIRISNTQSRDLLSFQSESAMHVLGAHKSLASTFCQNPITDGVVGEEPTKSSKSSAFTHVIEFPTTFKAFRIADNSKGQGCWGEPNVKYGQEHPKHSSNALPLRMLVAGQAAVL